MEIRFDGNLGTDAVLGNVSVGENQVARCYFWVAENVEKRDGSKKTIWTKVTIWRKYAETMAQYLKKGRHVLVEGTGEAKFYTDNNNAIRPYVEVQATKIRLLDGKPEEQVPPEVEAAEDETPVTAEELPW